jgi:hypothetical protein
MADLAHATPGLPGRRKGLEAMRNLPLPTEGAGAVRQALLIDMEAVAAMLLGRDDLPFFPWAP